jgi:transcriptional regulator with XRE-family HTH domain
MYNHIFCTNIIKLLDAKGITKKELAQKSNISISFISDLTNEKSNPSLKVIESIADALEIPLPLLFESDLDIESLNLPKGQAHKKLPKGFLRISATLPEHQAYIVCKWSEKAKQKIQKIKKNDQN